MAGQFDLPDWLTTQNPWSGSDAFIKGSQAGAAIAANRLRAKALYVDVQQHQQKMDLAERQFATENEAATLKNEVIRTKLANDAADFQTLREWWPSFQSSEGEIDMPVLRDENTMLKVAAAVAEKRSKIGQAAFAELMATPGFDLANPEDQKKYFEMLSRYKNIPAKLGPDGVMGPIKVAEGLKRLRDEADSRIAERDRKAAMADNMGWVYPEDGSPPYLVDAKGGTRLAPFRAGLDDGFTPEETKIGDVTLIRTSPNRWQVVNKSIPAGRMTDLEKVNLSDIRKQRQALVDTIASEAPTLKTGLFGSGNKAAVDAYKAQADKIAALTARESSLIQAVEARDKPASPERQGPPNRREGLKTEDRNAPPAVVAPTGKVRVISPDGTPGFIPAGQLEEALKAGYTKP